MMSRGPQGGLFSFPVATREGVVRYMVIETFLHGAEPVRERPSGAACSRRA
jgi:hypothetical protein